MISFLNIRLFGAIFIRKEIKMANFQQESFLQWRVNRISRETRNAASIFIVPVGVQPIEYHAGQFLTLIFDRNGRELRRSYSFSSSPEIEQDISFTVKRIPNGEISRFLLDHLRPGQILESLAPAGRFTLEPKFTENKQVFLIAAGVGISPEFSLLKMLLHAQIDCRIVLVTQNRDEEHIIFRSAINKLEKEYDKKFKWISILSRPKQNPRAGEYLTNELLEKIVSTEQSQDREKIFFLCGPPALMRNWHFTLRWMGYKEVQIRKETFNIEYIPPPPLLADQSSKNVELSFRGILHRFQVKYPSNILEAALKNNIQLPYSCRAGRCSTCVAKCLSGKIKMSINEVLTDKDLEEGWVLTCVGYPETDVILSYPQA